MQEELDQDLIQYMKAMLVDYNKEILNYDWVSFTNAYFPDPALAVQEQLCNQSIDDSDDCSCTDSIDNSIQSNPTPQVKIYKSRQNVKATDIERERSRNYYILHREEILVKRRLHRDRLIREGRYITYKKKRKSIIDRT